MTASRKRKRVSRLPQRALLERWWSEINEWCWPEEFGARGAINDGRDHFRGAHHVLSVILAYKPKPKRKARR